MRTSLEAIANRARESKKYRFRNLYTMLNRINLEDSWKYMNRSSKPGVDDQTVQDYENNFELNIISLVERLKQKRYRANLVKRVYIPKSKDKVRPLGLPITEDKLVQTAAARILTAIYEQDFTSSSHAYRPNMGPHKAGDLACKNLMFGRYNFVVEADVKSYFDKIDHDWLVKMLEQRIDDKAFIRLIKKWLKAGVMEKDGKVTDPETGSPQGGVISCVLANIYLHYTLDIWVEKVVKPRCEGNVYYCRFSDDFIVAFQNRQDADKFYKILPERLNKFGLELVLEKTRIIKFGRFSDENERFDFLGFEFRWVTSRGGKRYIKRKTSKKKLIKARKDFYEWIRKNRHLKMRIIFGKVNDKLRGHYDYYGIIGNYSCIESHYFHAQKSLFKWLNRRSQRKSYTWELFRKMLDHYCTLKPRITEKLNKQLEFF